MKLYVFGVAVVAFMLAGIIAVTGSAFAQEATQETIEISGKIVAVSEAEMSVTIQYPAGEETQQHEQATVYIGEATSIEKEYQDATIGDLAVGDMVYTGYTVNQEGKKEAVYLWVIKEEAPASEEPLPSDIM
ncbi:MAG: hypothetical protein JW844_00095 [Candidatus Omnitrophica bacterium]|nr:hypothetical protein [Candidatus Omnitrophota bacterium]